MGYRLNALLGNSKELEILTARFENAIAVNLHGNLGMIPLTNDLFDEINAFQTSDALFNFYFFTNYMEARILQILPAGMIAYIEAEYFGGTGTQSAILWNEGSRSTFIEEGSGSINTILRQFGVARAADQDEFETVGLGKNRSTEDWLEE